MKNKTEQRGFTLVELMIVISILGIIGAIGSTSLLNFLPTMRLKSAARDVFSTMMRAKVEAIRRGENVTIRFNPPLTPYTPADARIPLNSYLMFIDNGAGGGVANDEIINGTEPILVAATVLPDRVTFDPAVAGDGVSFFADAMVFSSRGIPVRAGGGFALGAGTVGLRSIDSLGNTMRQRTVVASTAGRINMP